MVSSFSAREASAPARMSWSAVILSRQNGSPKRQLVLRQGAGLVGTQHVHAGQFLDGDQLAHDRLLLGEQARTDRHRHRQNRGHRHGDRGHGQHQRELQRREDRRRRDRFQ